MELNMGVNGEAIDAAIEKGTGYLLSANNNGHWKGFPTLAGESDIWVTGFVLAHIQKLCPQTNTIGKTEDFLLQSRSVDGGWSYSRHVPPDADSTAWCLQALQSCNKFTETDAAKAKTFLWNHYNGKGISTYRTESGIRAFIGAPADELIAGWTSTHPDVSIAAVLADGQQEKAAAIINWLTDHQKNNGFIYSYWWRTPQYATALLLRALEKRKQLLSKEQAGLIAALLVQKQLADGGFGLDSSVIMDPFSTALALELFTYLTSAGYQHEQMNCGRALLQTQQENGSWSGDYILRIPAPYVTDINQVASWNNADGGGNSLINDTDGLFATAMACYALHCWRNANVKNNNRC